MVLPQIKSSDTFLESQQRFIDFGSINFSLFALVDGISPSLAAGEINERNLAQHFVLFVMVHEGNLEDGVGTRGVSIGAVLGGNPHGTSSSNCLHEFSWILYRLDSQTHNINILLAVFSRLELLPVIQQIEQLPAVYFIERNSNS